MSTGRVLSYRSFSATNLTSLRRSERPVGHHSKQHSTKPLNGCFRFFSYAVDHIVTVYNMHASITILLRFAFAHMLYFTLLALHVLQLTCIRLMLTTAKGFQNQRLWIAILFYELRIPACCVFAIFGCETSETTQARTSSCSVTCSNCHQYLLHRHCSSHLQRGKQWLHMKSGTSFGATSQMHWASWKNFSETCPRQRKRRLPILTSSNAATATK